MRTSVPLAVSSAASFSSRSSRRAVKMSLAPCFASSRANAAPIPELAPVTSAHLPLKSCVLAIAVHHNKWTSAGQTVPLLPRILRLKDSAGVEARPILLVGALDVREQPIAQITHQLDRKR